MKDYLSLSHKESQMIFRMLLDEIKYWENSISEKDEEYKQGALKDAKNLLEKLK